MNEWIDNNIGVDNVDMNIWWRLALILGIIIAAYYLVASHCPWHQENSVEDKHAD